MGPKSNQYNPVVAIQEALDQEKDVVVAPDVYKLFKSIFMKVQNRVLPGMGRATLVVSNDGTPCVFVPPGSAGVRLAGFVLQVSKRAGQVDEEEPSCRNRPGRLFHRSGEKHNRGGGGSGSDDPDPSTLSALVSHSRLEWGLENHRRDPGDPSNPGAMSVMFSPVGGDSYEDRNQYPVHF